MQFTALPLDVNFFLDETGGVTPCWLYIRKFKRNSTIQQSFKKQKKGEEKD
jgi:hypothetical protein